MNLSAARKQEVWSLKAEVIHSDNCKLQHVSYDKWILSK